MKPKIVENGFGNVAESLRVRSEGGRVAGRASHGASKRAGISLVTAGCLAVACQLGASDDLLDGVPEQAALQFQVTGAAELEGLATEEEFVDASALLAEELGQSLQEGDDSSLLRGSQGGVRDFNDALREMLEPVLALVRDGSAEPGRAVGVWGPVTRGATEYKLTLRRGGFRRFGWKLEARAAGSEDGFIAVAAGALIRDGRPRRGVGTAGFDFDALGLVDPTRRARGRLLVGFAHGGVGATLAYRADEFTPDPARHAPFDARLRAIAGTAGARSVRLAYRGNIADTASEAEELVLARARVRRAEGGRIDALLLEGDIASGKVWIKSECFDEDAKVTYATLRECELTSLSASRCTKMSETGERQACLPEFLEEELPPLDATEEEPSGDASVEAPLAMPSGDPPSEP